VAEGNGSCVAVGDKVAVIVGTAVGNDGGVNVGGAGVAVNVSKTTAVGEEVDVAEGLVAVG
jgi:hypothetical protein